MANGDQNGVFAVQFGPEIQPTREGPAAAAGGFSHPSPRGSSDPDWVSVGSVAQTLKIVGHLGLARIEEKEEEEKRKKRKEKKKWIGP